MLARSPFVLVALLLVAPFASAEPEPLVSVACGSSVGADGTPTSGCSAGSVAFACPACGSFDPLAWQTFARVVATCQAIDAAAPTNLADSDAAGMTSECGVHGTGVDAPVEPLANKIVICWYDQWGYWNCIVVEGQGPGMATL